MPFKYFKKYFSLHFNITYKVILIFIIFSFITFCLSPKSHAEDLKIITDKAIYNNEDKIVTIEITNFSPDKTYIWLGSCSLTLEVYKDNKWITSPASWSRCPMCGIEREMPDPIFLSCNDTRKIVWDKKVAWCDDGTMQKGYIDGKFRFVFQYEEDDKQCQFSADPLECWQGYRHKNFYYAYSNHFIIKEPNSFIDE